MERTDTCCVHCTHSYDLQNLKAERRRSVGKIHKDGDLIQMLSVCYELDEVRLRNEIGFDETSYFVCNHCFNSLKAACVSASKLKGLMEKVKTCGSPKFAGISASCLKNRNSIQTYQDATLIATDDTEESLPSLTPALESTIKKRQRNCFTPSRSGCTPKAKKKATTKTPKKNRRRLQFTPHNDVHVSTPSVVQSPGPKVKVHLRFKGSSRKTDLKGLAKLACRSLVQKQYKTALNHLLTIDGTKKELANAIKKTVSQEVRSVCSNKDSAFRGANVSKFSWKSAHRELERQCPLTLELLKIVAGNGKTPKHMPRVVSSMSILLFNRNQMMNSIQSINSILMFRGHVRTKVYSTFKRAGLSASYKTTLSQVDKLCEAFDLPVKKWAEKVAQQQTTDKTDAIPSDHSYAVNNDAISQTVDITMTTISSATETRDMHMTDIDVNCEERCTTPCPQMKDISDYQCEIDEQDTDHQENVDPKTPMNCMPHNRTSLGSSIDTPALDKQDFDSPFVTRSSDACAEEDGLFQIIMDNLNLTQKTRHKTMDTNNKVHNLTHSIAVKDRVKEDDLDNIYPQADILTTPNSAFLPNENDLTALKSDFKTLIQRTLVENIPSFKCCKDIVQYHIPHAYAEESTKKSQVVPLGILEKDENITEQMIEIMEHLQQYVPKTHKMIPLLLGGDALSVERGIAAQRARADGVTEEDKLAGLTWKSEDWHGHIISLQDTFNMHFKGTSSGEKGTLFQLRNYFDRRGVKSEVKDSVNDCREFLRFVTKGYIILAALQVMNVESVESVPDPGKSEDEQRRLLDELSSEIVDRFVPMKQVVLDENIRNNNTNVGKQKERIPCGYPGCPKTYTVDGKCRAKHRQTCLYKDYPEELLIEEEPANVVHNPDTFVQETFEKDLKYNYSCSLLKDGLLDWCREDAAKENDGDRLVRLWRFDMLRFHRNNHTKYRLLAFNLQAQLMALFTQRQAHQLRHNRCVNIHGGKGCNVPGDLALEFMNMRAKDALASTGGNLTSSSIERCGRSLQGCNDVIDAYTDGLQQYFGKPSNSKPSLEKDIKCMVKQLLPENLFEEIPGRVHRSFGSIKSDVCDDINTTKLNDWLTVKKEDYAKTQRQRSYVI